MKVLTFVPFPRGFRSGPDYVDARVLAASVEETHTVPAGAGIVVFSANTDFYARVGATAAVPGTDVTDGSAAELNPTGYRVSPGDVIHLIAPGTAIVTLTFYAA